MAHLVVVESKPTAGFEILRAAAGLGHEVTFVAHSLGPYLRSDGAEAALATATRVITSVATADPGALFAALEPVHRQSPVHGMTTLSEGHVRATAEVAERLGLRHERPEVTARLRDKHEVRTLLARAGVPQPGFAAAATAEEAVAAADGLGYPVVVKPADGFGSLGVGVARTAAQVAELAEAITATRGYGRSVASSGAVLVESYVQGPVVSCEMLTVDGEHRAYGCTDRVLAPPPHPVELGGCFPAELEPDLLAEVERVCAAALDAVGVRRSHTHTELVLGPDGPQIIEINGRLVGGYVPEMMNLVLGRNVYHDVVDLAVGGSPAPSAAGGVACIRAITAPRPGVLAALDVEGVRRSPGVAEVLVDTAVGQRVGPARANGDRLGFLIAAGPSAAAVTGAAEAALARAVVRVTADAAT
ncbi:ATP-grasp domain-containing protein [Streptomyces sp. NPDC046215]|uniref:ATP-grasp domain-containing protein n=1 Tax=Streptomyces sp. NPDC046215 TaxID=3155774 RepID=UPI0033E0ABFD